MSTKMSKTLDYQGFLVGVPTITPDLVAVVGTYPICKCLWLSLEPGLDIVWTNIFRAGKHVDFVVTMLVILCSKFQCCKVKAHGLLYLLALFYRIKQMVLSPVVRVVFRDLFKELHPLTVPRDYVITCHEFTVLCGSNSSSEPTPLESNH